MPCQVEFQNKAERTDTRNAYPLLNYIPPGTLVCILRQQDSEKEKLPLLCETGRWARQRQTETERESESEVEGGEGGRDLKQTIREAT